MTQRRSVYFVPDPFASPPRKIELGTVYEGEGFYYAESIHDRGNFDSLSQPQQACVSLIMQDLQEDDWDDTHRLPASVGPQVVFGDMEKY